jgi:hypothetical protein
MDRATIASNSRRTSLLEVAELEAVGPEPSDDRRIEILLQTATPCGQFFKYHCTARPIPSSKGIFAVHPNRSAAREVSSLRRG